MSYDGKYLFCYFFITSYLYIYIETHDGSNAHTEKWKNSLKKKAFAAYEAHVSAGLPLEKQLNSIKTRELGVRGNGVSYVVHDVFPTFRNASDTCGDAMNGPSNSMAEALRGDNARCERDHEDGYKSIQFYGCDHDYLNMRIYDSYDCTGDFYKNSHPLETCHLDSDGFEFAKDRCSVKYPFKMQGGALFT